jgi:hypothetical protein
VHSVTAGANIVVTGTAVDPIVNAALVTPSPSGLFPFPSSVSVDGYGRVRNVVAAVANPMRSLATPLQSVTLPFNPVATSAPWDTSDVSPPFTVPLNGVYLIVLQLYFPAITQANMGLGDSVVAYMNNSGPIVGTQLYYTYCGPAPAFLNNTQSSCSIATLSSAESYELGVITNNESASLYLGNCNAVLTLVPLVSL